MPSYQTWQNPSILASVNLQFCKNPKRLTNSDIPAFQANPAHFYTIYNGKISLVTGYNLRLTEI
jgi:hypothetical protein